MKTQKGILTLSGIIIIVAVAIIAFGGIFAYQYLTPEPSNNQQNSVACTMEAKICPDGSSVGRTGPNCEFTACPAVVDQTADWKIYSNTNGYTLKYPSNLILSAPSNPNYVEIKSLSTAEKPFFAYIEVKGNTNDLTVQDYANRVITGGAASNKNIVVEDITVGGITGKKVTKDNPPSDANPENPNYVAENTLNDSIIYLIKDNKLYVFEIYNKDGLVIYDSKIANQIISTFKFTK